jgi:hypothetical protein
MSFVRSIATRRAPFLSSGIAQRAAFSQSIVRCAGKESKLRMLINSIQIDRQLLTLARHRRPLRRSRGAEAGAATEAEAGQAALGGGSCK